MAKKKQIDYDSLYDSEYDRWSGTFNTITILDSPEKSTKKTGTKTVKKKK